MSQGPCDQVIDALERERALSARLAAALRDAVGTMTEVAAGLGMTVTFDLALRALAAYDESRAEGRMP